MPKFDARAALSLIKQLAITSFIAVPTMIQDLKAAAAAADTEEGSATGDSAGGPGSGDPAGRRQPRCWPSVQRILVGAGGTSGQMQVQSLLSTVALFVTYPVPKLRLHVKLPGTAAYRTISLPHLPLSPP